ncbi:uncharacterized protein LOC110876260 [Helianthus annuus]|uniref:uncharacterized protein LOC110876260 n=1 Tax=Helianthus annuus TaxID=4232 RepID=UPI000B90222B|nr:uncharacterized protein LOC110876260 [Helianthus annuus]
MEAIHILQRLMEKYREKKWDLLMMFIDLVKAYDKDTKSFLVEVGLHQGSALGPFLVAVVLDELSKSIQETFCGAWLVAETRQSLNARLEECRPTLEGKGLRISRCKAEYIYCDFNGAGENENTQVTFEGQVVPQTTKFKRFPTKLRGNFYRVAVRSAMLYGTYCWAIKKTQAPKMEVADMKMLRWMCGHTRLDRIRSEVFRECLGVYNIPDKLKEERLRWFGHVKRRQSTEPFRIVNP